MSRRNNNVASRTLITGATVITMDEKLGDIAGADLLVEDDRIAAIEPAGRIPRQGVDVVDAKNSIIIPGLVYGLGRVAAHLWRAGE